MPPFEKGQRFNKNLFAENSLQFMRLNSLPPNDLCVFNDDHTLFKVPRKLLVSLDRALKMSLKIYPL